MRKLLMGKLFDWLSDLIDKIDIWIDDEFAFFASKVPYFGRHYKSRIKIDEDVEFYRDRCYGCMAPSVEPEDCALCERRRVNERTD